MVAYKARIGDADPYITGRSLERQLATRDVLYIPVHIRHHWVLMLLKSDGAKIHAHVYDSAPSTVVMNDVCNLCAAMKLPRPRFHSVWQQVKGSNQCGLFVIFAVFMLTKNGHVPIEADEPTRIDLHKWRRILMLRTIQDSFDSTIEQELLQVAPLQHENSTVATPRNDGFCHTRGGEQHTRWSHNPYAVDVLHEFSPPPYYGPHWHVSEPRRSNVRGEVALTRQVPTQAPHARTVAHAPREQATVATRPISPTVTSDTTQSGVQPRQLVASPRSSPTAPFGETSPTAKLSAPHSKPESQAKEPEQEKEQKRVVNDDASENVTAQDQLCTTVEVKPYGVLGTGGISERS